MSVDETRPVGRLELWSVYRANHGIYKKVLVAMKYVPQKSIELQTFRALVDRALRERVLVDQPLLSCIVENGKSDRPIFKKVQFAEMPIELVDECPDMNNFFVREHERGPTNDRLWRASIVPAESAFWVSFAFHHGVGDGTSGLIFHELLLKALQELTDSSRLEITHARSLPPAVEHSGLVFPRPWKTLIRTMALKLPLPGMIRTYLEEPAFYGGRKTTIEQRLNRRTYVKTFTLSNDQVHKLRRSAKLNKISIHALLHGAAVHSIQTELPIKTSTPINLRPLMPNSKDRLIANYACGHASLSPREETPLATARAYYAELNDPKARQEAIANVGLLQYVKLEAGPSGIPGLEQVILDRVNTDKEHSLSFTLEISNLGNVSTAQCRARREELTKQWNAPVLHDWQVEHVHFSGSNSGIGELFCVGVATVAGGIMNITCTATPSYVDIEEVDTFMQTFEETLHGLPDA